MDIPTVEVKLVYVDLEVHYEPHPLLEKETLNSI